MKENINNEFNKETKGYYNLFKLNTRFVIKVFNL